MDMLGASGGVPDPPQGAALQSRFFNLQSALLAARRLQWGLEGLAESSGVAASAAMLIHSVDEPNAGSATHTLERLSPGQVLLSAGMADPVQQLPGFAVRPAFDGNWRELQWQSQGASTSLASDEQSVLGLIRALGRQDPCPPPAEAPTPPAPPPVTATTGVFHAPASLGRSLEEPEPAAGPFWKKPWVLVSAGAMVLVLVAAMIIPMMTSGGRPKPPVADAPTQTAAPAPAPSTPPSSSQPSGAGSVAPEKPHDQKPSPKTSRPPKPLANPGGMTEPSTPKPPAGSCDLTEGEIPLSLQRAQTLMYAGKLEDAQDAFQHLVSCPSARDRALDGLRQVKARMATQ
jgi:hypothetical protein